MEENKGKNKILIVEDDDMLAEIYQKKFGGGYELSIVKNGKDAIEEAKKNKPDLVLLDLVMPEIDGFQALQALKGDPETKDIKVVITSNLSQESEKEKALKMGAVDFLVKSNYDLEQLAGKIRSYL